MRIFDSHVHFVDPSRPEGVLWPESDKAYFGRRLPDDLLESTQTSSLTGCIAVETSRRSIDDDWLLQLANKHALIEGIVLNLQPDSHGFAVRLEQARRSKKFVGVRFRPIGEYALDAPVLQESLELLQRDRSTIEFGAESSELKRSFARLASRFPETNWILDHCGHPKAADSPAPEWCDGVNEIAELPNAFCKVSSDYSTTAIWGSVLSYLLKAFGPARLMYGSNWPAVSQSVGLDAPASQLSAFFGDHSDDILEGNARRAYGVTDTANGNPTDE
ncbi:MAG: amidohydrolase family protein [Pseudomonadota bacterium]